jgi:glycosyltransferase involved in cell wall biosynthesis
MSDKPKLVVLSAFYEPYMSGAEQMVREICERLGDKYELTLVTGLYDKKNERIEQRPNFKLIRVGIGHKQLDKLLYIFLGALKVCEIKPRIAHAIMESYAGGALILVKYLTPRVKRVLTLQSGDLDDPRKKDRLHHKLVWPIMHKSPDRVTAISTALKTRAVKYGIAEDKTEITPNGFNPEEVSQAVEKEKGLVISMGRLSWEKGFEYLLEAWPSVKKNIPSARLEIFGEGDKKEELLKMIKNLKIDDSIKIRGLIEHSEFMRELKRAEVYVQASIAEGLGLVYIEAQASGVPPVGTRAGGIPDVIQNEENGLLVEPKDPKALAVAMIRLLKDKDLYERLKQKGLETSRQYEWGRIIEKINIVYQKLSTNG